MHAVFGGFGVAVPTKSSVHIRKFVAVDNFTIRLCPVSVRFLGNSSSPARIRGMRAPFSICSGGNALCMRTARNTTVGIFSVGNHRVTGAITGDALSSFDGLGAGRIVMAISDGTVGAVVGWSIWP